MRNLLKEFESAQEERDEDIQISTIEAIDNYLASVLGITTRAIRKMRKENPMRLQRETIGAFLLNTGIGFNTALSHFINNQNLLVIDNESKQKLIGLDLMINGSSSSTGELLDNTQSYYILNYLNHAFRDFRDDDGYKLLFSLPFKDDIEPEKVLSLLRVVKINMHTHLLNDNNSFTLDLYNYATDELLDLIEIYKKVKKDFPNFKQYKTTSYINEFDISLSYKEDEFSVQNSDDLSVIELLHEKKNPVSQMLFTYKIDKNRSLLIVGAEAEENQYNYFTKFEFYDIDTENDTLVSANSFDIDKHLAIENPEEFCINIKNLFLKLNIEMNSDLNTLLKDFLDPKRIITDRGNEVECVGKISTTLEEKINNLRERISGAIVLVALDNISMGLGLALNDAIHDYITVPKKVLLRELGFYDVAPKKEDETDQLKYTPQYFSNSTSYKTMAYSGFDANDELNLLKTDEEAENTIRELENELANYTFKTTGKSFR